MRYYLGKMPLLLFNIYDNLKLIKNFFFNRIPVYKDNMSCQPILIISAGRSGTTLLRVMLTRNSKISIPPESQFFHKAIRKFKSYNYMGWEEILKIVIGELESKKNFKFWNLDVNHIYRNLLKIDKNERSLAKIIDEIYLQFSREKNPNAIMWGDKSPLHTYYIHWINKIFPKAKYIHLVRDGRAAVNSMLNRNNKDDTLENSCKRWNESINMIKKFRKNKSDKEYFELKYEYLVDNPRKALKSICKFIGIQFEEIMLETSKNVENYGDTKLSHHKNLKNPINTNSVMKWNKELSSIEKKIITSKLKKNLKLYGYI